MSENKPLFDLETRIKNKLGMVPVVEQPQTTAMPTPEKIEIPEPQPAPPPPSLRDLRPAYSPQRLRSTNERLL